ncbi:LADA_0E09252g1_1 [Lachancea dasiensis]|uniref:LADA_0E09252g1_1 n=1 Tax=Lachancea dasiensis TaxID=1072105 RepID=A0A1G4JDS9_9SACH|nr:LADA_0E09252g1_1 [Lachancea dasiensis]
MNKPIERWLSVYLKCFINVILYFRNVYPKEAFDWLSYQAFNLPRHMPMNRHPDLQNYIETLVKDILTKLESIRQFNLRIVQVQDGACIERYALDFSEFRHEEADEELEIQVFDELRSSLNSLIARLEKLPVVKPASVTFEVAIDAVGLSLGRQMSRVHNLKERLTQEQDFNWVKCSEDTFSSPRSPQGQQQLPRVKMIALAGCEAGPLVIYQFMEILLSTPDTTSQVYESSDSSQQSRSDPFP